MPFLPKAEKTFILHVSSNPYRNNAKYLFFSYIRLWRAILLRTDIRLTPSDMRFARLGGEYNITVSGANNTLWRKQKYFALWRMLHADGVSISLKKLYSSKTHKMYAIFGRGTFAGRLCNFSELKSSKRLNFNI